MKDFLTTLYSNENFPIFLGLFIILLVIAFVLVYYWGRKDQKLIETRKLEKLDIDAFKETSNGEKVELEDKKVDNSFEYTKAIELPKLNNEREDNKSSDINLKHDETKIATLEDMPKRRVDKTDIFYEDTKEVELPRLKG